MRLKVTFILDDRDHDEVMDLVSSIGGYDVEVDEVEVEEPRPTGRRSKKGFV